MRCAHFNRVTPSILTLLVSFGATACENPTDLVLPSLNLSVADHQSVTGGASLPFRDYFVRLTFSAGRRNDGAVSGEFQTFGVVSHNPVHGDVTCFTIVGNRAWIGGITRKVAGQSQAIDAG